MLSPCAAPRLMPYEQALNSKPQKINHIETKEVVDIAACHQPRLVLASCNIMLAAERGNIAYGEQVTTQMIEEYSPI